MRSRLLAEPGPDLWDSGTVSSSDMSNIAYAGTALASRTAVVWDVGQLLRRAHVLDDQRDGGGSGGRE